MECCLALDLDLVIPPLEDASKLRLDTKIGVLLGAVEEESLAVALEAC